MSPYLEAIEKDLKLCVGKDEVRSEVWKAALSMDRLPGEGAPGSLKRGFAVWVSKMGYLNPENLRPRPWVHDLPLTVMEPHDGDKPSGVDENGLTMDRWRRYAREKRIKRAARQFRTGMEERELVAFVCSIEELDAALDMVQPEEEPPDDPKRWWDR